LVQQANKKEKSRLLTVLILLYAGAAIKGLLLKEYPIMLKAALE
jgi:hypothetical protein